MATAAMAELVEELLDGVVRRYRIDKDQARGIVREHLRGERGLAALSGKDAASIRRTAVWKNAESGARKAVYYALRQYRSAGDLRSLAAELAAAGEDARGAIVRRIVEKHVSTRERLASLKDFHAGVRDFFPEGARVLDLGCGVYPLLFAESALPRPAEYLALDADADSVAAVEAYAGAAGAGWLRAQTWRCGDGWSVLGGAAFDVALMLKLVPVVHRQERDSLEILRDVSARTLILSGAKESMTKRRDISRRERGILRAFVEGIVGEVAAEFETADEVVMVVRKPSANPKGRIVER